MSIRERVMAQQATIRAALERLCDPGETVLHAAMATHVAQGSVALWMVVSMAGGALVTTLLFGRDVNVFKWLSFIAFSALIGARPLSRATKQYLVGVTDRRLLVAQLRPQTWKVDLQAVAETTAFDRKTWPTISVRKRSLRATVTIAAADRRLKFDLPTVGPGKAESEAIVEALASTSSPGGHEREGHQQA